MSRDGGLLVAARSLRMLAYGFLSVILALYLSGIGYAAAEIGVLFTVALAGSAAATLGLALRADRWGRRRTLAISGLLMAASGAVFALNGSFALLLVVAAVGALSPSGQDVGPFQSLEQAALSQGLAEPGRVLPYAWYNLAGTFAVALGALVAGAVPTALQRAGWGAIAAQQALLWVFAAIGLALCGLYLCLSPAIEAPLSRAEQAPGHRPDPAPGLHRSRRIVFRLSALFALDSLAGGFVIQSLVAFWFHERFGLGLAQLGPLFFGTNVLSALSYLLAAPIAHRFGLLNTMVFTHLPSNVLLAMVPFAPAWPLAAGLLLARHALSQMDVPTRQAYTMVLVAPEERAAAAGLTNAVRPIAASVAPALSGVALGATSVAVAVSVPFVLAGGLKIVYDLLLWAMFRRVPLQTEEIPPGPMPAAPPEP